MKRVTFLILGLCVLFIGCNQIGGCNQSAFAPDSEADSAPDGKSTINFEFGGQMTKVSVPQGLELEVLSSSTPNMVEGGQLQNKSYLEEFMVDEDGVVGYPIQIRQQGNKLLEESSIVSLDNGMDGYEVEIENAAINTVYFYSDAYGNFAWILPEDLPSEDVQSQEKTIIKVPLNEALNDEDNQFRYSIMEDSTIAAIVPVSITDPDGFEADTTFGKRWIPILNRYSIKQIVSDGPGKWKYKLLFKPENFDLSKPSLLLIHGTNAGPKVAYSALLTKELETLRAKYDDRIFAFVHPSVRKNVSHNAERLNTKLKNWGFEKLDILARSRGCLVARYLIEETDFTKDKKNQVKRVVMIAGPHFGTHGAGEGNRRKAFKVSKLLKKLPPFYKFKLKEKGRDFAYNTLLYWDELPKTAEGFSSDREIAIPGILDMEIGGELLNELNSVENSVKRKGIFYYGIAGSIDLNEDTWKTAKLIRKTKKVKPRIDGIFKDSGKRVENDGVIPTVGAFGRSWDAQVSSIPISFKCNYQLKSPSSSQAHHINYMNFEEIRKAILYFLMDESGKCPGSYTDL